VGSTRELVIEMGLTSPTHRKISIITVYGHITLDSTPPQGDDAVRASCFDIEEAETEGLTERSSGGGMVRYGTIEPKATKHF